MEQIDKFTPKRLLNKAETRRFALDIASSHRGGRFTRVSKEAFMVWEVRLKEIIRSHIHSLPSKGKTI
jgi:hypothetical protein